jgi:mRNA-degrading endonuclease RelE of RelBE toxin-antitoxin system
MDDPGSAGHGTPARPGGEGDLGVVEERLAENSTRLSKPVTGELAGKRSVRNGDYRVLIRLDKDQHVVWIVHVNHRAHLYRRR